MVLTIQGPIVNLLKVMNHKKQTADSVTEGCKQFCCESYTDEYGHMYRYYRNKRLHQNKYSKHFSSQSKEITAVSLTLIL